MIWTIGQFPELDHLKPAERAALLARVPWWTYPLLIVGSLIQGLVLGGICLGYSYAVTRSFNTSGIVGLVITVVAAVALYHYRLGRVRADMRRTLADAFLGERPPFCFNCGYDLRASKETRCPECGTEVGPSR
jgi:uncharacterized membrane protein